jgi:hypothetical protein
MLFGGAHGASVLSQEVFDCPLGVTGVYPEAGLTTGGAEEAAMKRALSARAADTYILASFEKIGMASRFRVLPWQEVSGVITDADPHDAVVDRLGALGVEVLSAGADRRTYARARRRAGRAARRPLVNGRAGKREHAAAESSAAVPGHRRDALRGRPSSGRPALPGKRAP